MKTMLNKRVKLEEARKAKGFTRIELARLVGCTAEHIKSLEYGRVNPSAQMMYKICAALEKKPEDLFSDIAF